MIRFIDGIKAFLQKVWALPSAFILSFFLWVFCFRGFLSGRLALESDAISYYNHIKFFIDNMMHGIYPLWDPVWNCGSPNEFFLRRFGSFNPLFLLIVLLRKLGVSHQSAYLSFLSLYYFLGMIGFYLLAKRIFQNRLTAFAAYLLLMFSSLATRPFDSFIIFEFVPMVWFFFFLVSFLQTPRRGLLLGLTFSLMVIFTTYLPFYFITIFLISAAVFALVYPLECKNSLLRGIGFLKRQRFLACICAIAFCLSLIPGIMLLKDSSRAEFVLPARSESAHTGNTIEVGYKTIAGWGITEDLVYSSAFNDLRRFKFAVMYVPIFAYIPLLLGMFLRGNRRLIFLFLLGASVYLFHCPYAPIYKFLYNHIFYYKYFRNLHFFLWWIILPVFILFSVENLRLFLEYQPKRDKHRYLLAVFIAAAHIALAVFISMLGPVIISSYITIGLSMAFFIAHALGRFPKGITALFTMLIIVVVQPLEVYYYLAKNSSEETVDYLYDKPYQGFFEKRAPRIGSLHYASKWYSILVENISPAVLRKFASNKIYIFSRTAAIGQIDMVKQIESALKQEKDIAFISAPYKDTDIRDSQNSIFAAPLVIKEDDSWFHVLEYTANTLKIKTDFNSDKFLLYCDNYHSGWKAFINGSPVNILRTDIAFKGIWLPAGENVVYFRFGEWWRYCLNYFLLFVFYTIFAGLIFSGDLNEKTPRSLR